MSQESKFKCPAGEYWDGALRKCYPCLKVCQLDKTYCCRNCPDFCYVQIPNSAYNAPITTSTEEIPLVENQNSVQSLPLHVLLIFVIIITFLAVLGLAIWCFIRCVVKAKRHRHSNADAEAVKPFKANDPEDGPRERQPSDVSTSSLETSVKCCHFASQEDERKIINQGIVHSHVSDRHCFSNRYCLHQHDQLHNKVCPKHQPICQTSSCTLNHYRDDISGNTQHNIAAKEEMGPNSETLALNSPARNQSEEKCRSNEVDYNVQNDDREDLSLSDTQARPVSQVLYVEKGEGEVCYITKVSCDDIL